MLGNAAPFQAVVGAIAHYVERARGRGYQVEVSRTWSKKEAPLISGPRPTVVAGPFATYNQATAEADAIIAALRAGTYLDAP